MVWSEQFLGPVSGYTPGNSMRVCSPIKPVSNGRAQSGVDTFHVVHEVPVGDSPYVIAKHVQLVDRDPDRAIALFWAAINYGDRVDSALKDMAIVMKQQNRPQEAIEAIKSLRGRCSDQAQESLDNVLLDLFKRCGRIDDQIDLLKRKLHLIHQGMAFNGKRTKTARSQGKKFQVSVQQEATRLLGNLGWAYMQHANFVAAEAVYRKALSIESDNNKACNQGICLMKQGRLEEAKAMLQSVTLARHDSRSVSESHLKSFERAQEMLDELEKGFHDDKQSSLFTIPGCETETPSQSDSSSSPPTSPSSPSLWQPQPAVPRQPRRLPRSEQPSMNDALYATSGFGPMPPDHTNSIKLGMAGCLRIPQPAAKSFQPQWWLQGGLEDDDSFDYSSTDESSGGSARTSSFTSGSIEDEEMQWHFESLLTENIEEALISDSSGLKVEADSSKTELEFSSRIRDLTRSIELMQPLTAKGFSTKTNTHGDASESPVTFDLTNGDHHEIVKAEARRAVKPPVSTAMWTMPFRTTLSDFDNNWSRGDYDDNHSTIPPSRSPALEFDGVQVMKLSSSDTYPCVNLVGLPPCHATPVKQASRTAIQKKKTTKTTASTWDLMGFSYNPSELASVLANKGEIGSSSKEHEGLISSFSASEMEIRRQRRLRVFQEMTPSKTPQV